MPNSTPFTLDAPAEKDLLQRSAFAKVVAHTLALPRDSTAGLVVGIEGSWGSGKSTFLKIITQHLSESSGGNAPLVVVFNPWMISTSGSLVEALVSQSGLAIGADNSTGTKGIEVAEKLLGYANLFSKLKILKLVPGGTWFGNIAETVGEWAETAGKYKADGDEAVKSLKARFPKLDLLKQKQVVVQALSSLNRSIVVIVDDLDRLLPSEIQSMMQAIKAVADFPRVTYLLAYDRTIVAQALGNGSEVAGIDYLAKIVQVAYPLPQLFNRQRGMLADQQLKAFLHGGGFTLRPFERALWVEAISILAQLLLQPRDIVRLVNRLVLSVPYTHEDINVVDVIVFEALSMKYPLLRDVIHKHAHQFVGELRDDQILTPHSPSDHSSVVKVESANWASHVHAYDEVVKKACSFLFLDGEDSADQLRLRHPDHLAQLLRMTSIDGVFKAADIHDLLLHREKLQKAFSSLTSQDEILALQGWISYHANSYVDRDGMEAAEELVHQALQLAGEGKLNFALASGFISIIGILGNNASAGQDNLLERVALRAPLEIAGPVLRAVYSQYEVQLRKNEVPAGAARIVNSFLERVSDWVQQGGAGEGWQILMTLHAFRVLSGTDATAQRYVQKLSENEPWLERFLSGFAEDVIGQISGLILIADFDGLAARIESSPALSDAYAEFAEYLRSPQVQSAQALIRSTAR